MRDDNDVPLASSQSSSSQRNWREPTPRLPVSEDPVRRIAEAGPSAV